jgi:TonB family protein
MQLVLKAFQRATPWNERGRAADLNSSLSMSADDTSWRRLGYASVLACLFHVAVVAILLGFSPLSANQFGRGGDAFFATLTPLKKVESSKLSPSPIATASALAEKTLQETTPPQTAASAQIDKASQQAAEEAAWQAQYRLSSSLQKRPQPLADVQPVYPVKAGRTRGNVVLQLFINEAGGVDKVVVVSAKPEGIFEDSAVDAFRKASFSPGTLLGIPVKSQITINVSFTAFTIE